MMDLGRRHEPVNGPENPPSLSIGIVSVVNNDGGPGIRVLKIQIQDMWDCIRGSWDVRDSAKGPGGIGGDAPGVGGVLECHSSVDTLVGDLESAHVVRWDTGALDRVDSIGHHRHLGASIRMISSRRASGRGGDWGSFTLEI